eukprot:5651395-Pyramimonas_sp.AAC.1
MGGTIGWYLWMIPWVVPMSETRSRTSALRLEENRRLGNSVYRTTSNTGTRAFPLLLFPAGVP